MIINYIIILICLLFLFFYYKKTVVVLAIISPFLDNFYVPFSFPGNGGIFSLSAFFALLFFPFNVSKRSIIKYAYPFKWVTGIVFLSYCLSNIPRFHPGATMMLMISVYIYPCLLWICLDSYENLKLFVKTLIILSSLFVVYGFYEVITGSNLIMEYLSQQGIISLLVAPDSFVRFGLKRMQSFAPFLGAAGMLSGMWFITLLLLKTYFNKLFLLSSKIYILLAGLFCCVFFTGTRSVIAGFAVGLLAFVNPKFLFQKNTIRIIVFIVIFTPVVYSYTSDYISQVYKSFSETESVEGSSTDMREGQIAVVLNYWAKSPIIGNGYAFATNEIVRQVEGAYGLESVWFPLLIDYGILGCIAFFLTIYIPILILRRRELKPVVFLILLFLADKTLSSIPGVSVGFHLLFVVFFIRLKQYLININNDIKYNYTCL